MNYWSKMISFLLKIATGIYNVGIVIVLNGFLLVNNLFNTKAWTKPKLPQKK